MTTSGKENFRLKSYKNKSLNPDEMRRRREEEGLQLRKQKREEQVMHRDLCEQPLNCPGLQCLCLSASPKSLLSCSALQIRIQSVWNQNHLHTSLSLLQVYET